MSPCAIASPRPPPDTDWITALSQEGDWTVVTHDRLNKGVEREVLKRAAIKVFLLDKSWKNQAFWAKAENLVLVTQHRGAG